MSKTKYERGDKVWFSLLTEDGTETRLLAGTVIETKELGHPRVACLQIMVHNLDAFEDREIGVHEVHWQWSYNPSRNYGEITLPVNMVRKDGE